MNGLDTVHRGPGIYLITNSANGKVYIGSSVNVARRARYHLRELQAGTHHNTHLQAAWWLYGPDVFSWAVHQVLDDTDRDSLTRCEQAWIDVYSSDQDTYGYNKAPAGRTRGRTGLKWSPEERKRISEGQRRFFAAGGTKNVARGADHVQAKLTEHDVRAIRAAYGPPRGRRYSRMGGVRLSDLTAQYGVNISVISDVVNRRSWRHLDD